MKKLLLLAFMAFIIASCSDDKDNSPTAPSGNNTGSFFPSKVGNYWIYDVITEDDTEAPTQDSMYVTGPITEQNREGMIFESINYATNETSEVYYSTEGAKLYAFSNFTSTFSMEGFSTEDFFEPQWLMMIDTSDVDWKIVRTGKQKRTIDFEGTEMEVEIEISADGERSADTIYTIEDKDFKCHKYTMYMNVGMNIAVFAMDIDIVQDIYIVDGIGIVEQYQRPFTVNIPMVGEQEIPGMIRKLIRYNIK